QHVSVPLERQAATVARRARGEISRGPFRVGVDFKDSRMLSVGAALRGRPLRQRWASTTNDAVNNEGRPRSAARTEGTIVMDVRELVSSEEWQVRVDLAAAYRLVAAYGWDDLVFTHISARVPGPEHHFLINPYGMMFEEITASSLVKVDLAGSIVMESE